MTLDEADRSDPLTWPTAKEAAGMLDLEQNTVRHRLNQGSLRGTRIPKGSRYEWRVDPDSLASSVTAERTRVEASTTVRPLRAVGVHEGATAETEVEQGRSEPAAEENAALRDRVAALERENAALTERLQAREEELARTKAALRSYLDE